MEPSVLEMVKELVLAQIQAGGVSPENLTEILNDTHKNLLSLKSIEVAKSQSEPGMISPSGLPTDWKKSITKHAIRCLECGASFKQLSTRHLRQHELTGRLYREKYGIPKTQSLAAKDTTARRKQIVQQSKPWEKTSTYQKSQGTNGSSPSPAKTTAKRKNQAKKSTASKA